jgi:hypothetical protein
VTYLLLTNPSCLEKVTKEVRSQFKHENEIKLTSVGNLTYMMACLNEALRVYPPVASGMPRQVPPGGAVIAGHFVPQDVRIQSKQMYMLLLTRDPIRSLTDQGVRIPMGNVPQHPALEEPLVLPAREVPRRSRLRHRQAGCPAAICCGAEELRWTKVRTQLLVSCTWSR